MELGLEVDEGHPPYAVLAVRGELDIATAPALREKLIELVRADATQIVVNLEKVTFIDSSGIGVLVGALRRLRGSGGDLRICCPNPAIAAVFEITGLTSVFQITDTVESAIAGPAE